MSIKKIKILITGHKGMVGSAVLKRLKFNSKYQIIVLGKNVDLRNQEIVKKNFQKHKPEYVINSAATVGGVYANNTFPSKFIYDNIMIQTNIIKASFDFKIKKLFFLGSSCIYPVKNSKIREDDLLTKKLETTNQWYSIAKISGIKLCQALNQEYKTKFLCLMPTNLYGPNDKYSGIDAHVIPALIEKFHYAKMNKSKVVEIWGDGTAKREFLFVDDFAEILDKLININSKRIFRITNKTMLINIGSGQEISIKKLSFLLKKIINFNGKLKFNKKKLTGKKRNCLDSSRLNKILPKIKFTNLENGLKKTYKNYLIKLNKNIKCI